MGENTKRIIKNKEQFHLKSPRNGSNRTSFTIAHQGMAVVEANVLSCYNPLVKDVAVFFHQSQVPVKEDHRRPVSRKSSLAPGKYFKPRSPSLRHFHYDSTRDQSKINKSDKLNQ